MHLYHGDCLEMLPTLPVGAADVLITDPPAGISFMGAEWDGSKGGRTRWIAWLASVLREAYRVLPPGACGLVWALPRTSHWTGMACEDAGFEVRDIISHVFATGFPKNLNVNNMASKSGKACICRKHALQYSYSDIGGCDAEEARAASDLRDMPTTVHAQESGSTEQGSLLLERMPGRVAGERSDDTGTHGVHRGEYEGAQAPGRVRAAEPGLEGRSDIQAVEGQLHRPEVCALPGGVPDDGALGRLRDGAPPPDGAAFGAVSGAAGGGTSSGSQPAKQRTRKPRIVARQRQSQGNGAWPTCERCGLPVIPDGLGTALKPAVEHWILIRKPIEGTVVDNVLRYGVGALNVDDCRVGTTGGGWNGLGDTHDETRWRLNNPDGVQRDTGRWPAHLVLSHSPACNGVCAEDCPIRVMGEQSGERASGALKPYQEASTNMFIGRARKKDYTKTADTGTAARYFTNLDADPFIYAPKASRRERNAGTEHLEARRGPAMNSRCVNCGAGRLDGRRIGACCDTPQYEDAAPAGNVTNHHPTVKSLALMRWLVRLITPPGGTVLDCFAGSGSTGVAALMEGRGFVGVEQSAEYLEIARARLAHAADPLRHMKEASEHAHVQ